MKKILKKKKPQPVHSVLEFQELASGSKLEHTGDLLINGDIHQGATITLTNGNLVVKGIVHDNVIINLIDSEPETKRRVHVDRFEINGAPAGIVAVMKFLDFYKEVGDNVTINGADTRSNITLYSSLGSNSRIITGIGAINAVTVGQNCTLQTNIGDIVVFFAHPGTRLNIIERGMVEALRVSEGINISVPKGDIFIQRVTGLKHATMFYTKDTHTSICGIEAAELVAKFHGTTKSGLVKK